MATSVQFYHLLHTPLERALPKLVERVLASGARAVIRTENEARAEALCDLLWTYDPESFLPHGTAKDGGDAALHPVYITAERGNPNGADILIITDGSTAEDAGDFIKLLDLFDGQDDEAVSAARTRWSSYNSAGHTLTYNKQQPSGGWAAA